MQIAVNEGIDLSGVPNNGIDVAKFLKDQLPEGQLQEVLDQAIDGGGGVTKFLGLIDNFKNLAESADDFSSDLVRLNIVNASESQQASEDIERISNDIRRLTGGLRELNSGESGESSQLSPAIPRFSLVAPWSRLPYLSYRRRSHSHMTSDISLFLARGALFVSAVQFNQVDESVLDDVLASLDAIETANEPTLATTDELLALSSDLANSQEPLVITLDEIGSKIEILVQTHGSIEQVPDVPLDFFLAVAEGYRRHRLRQIP